MCLLYIRPKIMNGFVATRNIMTLYPPFICNSYHKDLWYRVISQKKLFIYIYNTVHFVVQTSIFKRERRYEEIIILMVIVKEKTNFRMSSGNCKKRKKVLLPPHHEAGIFQLETILAIELCIEYQKDLNTLDHETSLLLLS